MISGIIIQSGLARVGCLKQKNGGKNPWDFQRHPEIPILAKHHGLQLPMVFGSLRVAAAERWFGAHLGYIKSPTIIREWGKAGTERFFQVSIITSWWMFFSDKKMMFSTSSNFTIPAQVYFIYDSNSIYFVLSHSMFGLSSYKNVLLKGGICR